MKKIGLLLVFSLVVLGCMAKDPYLDLKTEIKSFDTYRQISIGGSYGEYALVSFDIDEGGVDSVNGSGFSLTSRAVRPEDGSYGIILGTWTLSANFMPVTLTIDAQPLSMKYASAEGTKTAEVPYVLRFAYLYPEYEFDGSSSDVSDAFFVASNGYTGDLSKDNVPSDRLVRNGEFVFSKSNSAPQKLNIVDGQIRVFIPKDARDKVDDDSETPPGIYTATVTITLWSDK